MILEIEWAPTLNVEKRRPQITFTTIYDLDGRRAKTVHSLTDWEIESLSSFSIWDVIALAAGALLQARDALEDSQRAAVAERALALAVARPSPIIMEYPAQPPRGIDRSKLH